jgi:excisionase family DNA binding protein
MASAITSLDSQLLKVREAAMVMHVTDRTVRNWVDAGHLDAVRIGGTIRIRARDLAALIDPCDSQSLDTESLISVHKDDEPPEGAARREDNDQSQVGRGPG